MRVSWRAGNGVRGEVLRARSACRRRRIISESKRPGQSALTLIPSGAYSRAIVIVKMMNVARSTRWAHMGLPSLLCKRRFAKVARPGDGLV